MTITEWADSVLLPDWPELKACLVEVAANGACSDVEVVVDHAVVAGVYSGAVPDFLGEMIAAINSDRLARHLRARGLKVFLDRAEWEEHLFPEEDES